MLATNNSDALQLQFNRNDWEEHIKVAATNNATLTLSADLIKAVIPGAQLEGSSTFP